MDGLEIKPASFEAAFELKRAVFSVIQKSGLTFEGLLDSENNLDAVVSLILQIDTDRQVYDALWPCLERCLYKREKITKALFEDVKMREHYYTIVAKCLEENVMPFIGGLRSVWLALRGPLTSQAEK